MKRWDVGRPVMHKSPELYAKVVGVVTALHSRDGVHVEWNWRNGNKEGAWHPRDVLVPCCHNCKRPVREHGKGGKCLFGATKWS